MDDITIDMGVYTALTVDLTDFDFTGIDKLVLTVKNSEDVAAEEIIVRDFNEAKPYNITVTPAESMRISREGAYYDVDAITEDGKQYKITDNGKVVLRRGVGDCIDLR